MPLSISKLQDLLAKKGFIVTKFFVLDGSCFYLELFAIKTADVFFLYIPSKYTFEPSEGTPTFKIKYIDMESFDNLTDEYAERPDDLELKDKYGIMNADVEGLEGNYKHAISLTEVSKEDNTDLRAIYRQMKRLKFSVQNLKYKLGVVYKNYICAIRRDDTIDYLVVKNYPRDSEKRLVIIVDLETFYEKSEGLIEDVQTVRKNIYHVLERNQGTHGQVIGKLIENKKEIISIPLLASLKCAKYDSMLKKLETQLGIMVEAEKKELEKLESIKTGEEGLQNDINRVHQRSKIEKELDRINAIKARIGKVIIDLRVKNENMILSIDKIMFDNTIMLDSMVKNFSKLKDYC